jgi:FG-GAP-like repeat/Abnormal spindle-like microcephaly-assoc'd, ASPM-SPD-2-Hydin
MTMSCSSRIGFSVRLVLTVSMLGLVCPRIAQGQITFYQPPRGAGGNFVADFNGDDKPDLLSKDGTLQLGNGDGTFREGTPVPGGAVAVGDFNGDGKPDVLQLGTGGPLNGTLLVLLGNGDGTFQAPITTYAYVLQYVIAGNLNGDGKADVVGFESTIGSTTVVVYLSQSDGTFAPGVPYTISNAPLGGDLITLGDFNGDHTIDIAVSLEGGGEVVLLGNGDGTFQSGKASTGVSNPQLAIAGDFNDDGKLDVMLSGELLLGNGDGTFQAPTPVANGVAQAAADFNGDGRLDLVVAPDVTEICLGNGDGTFSDAYNYLEQGFEGIPPAEPPFLVTDFNADGKLDIAGGGYVLLGNGDGSFQGGLLTEPIIATSAVTGSFDKKGNGFEDLAEISSTSLYSLTNDGKGNLSLSSTYTLQQPGFGIATVDLNGDGYPDVVVAGTDPISQDWNYNVLLGNGDGSFQAPQFYPQSMAGAGSKVQYSIVVADFNNDHKLDVALGPVGNQSLAVLLGNGDGTFASPAYVYDGGGNSNATYLIAEDFNGDGNIDIAASPLGSSNPGTALLFGNGDGTFQPAVFPLLGNFTAYGTADFNHDRKADLWGEGTRGCQVLLGNGDGTFAVQDPFAPVCLLPIVVTDVNGDGILDIVADYYHASRFGGGYSDYWAYLGNGDGTFELPIEIPTASMTGTAPTFELAADMNGDGKPDLISNAGSGYTFVLINTTVSAPVATFSPSSVTFPSQTVGSSSEQTPVTLTNTGAVALTVTSITVSGANANAFSQANNCTKVQPNTKCTIKITFTPTVVGTASASVIVTDNASSGSQTIPLSGTGGAASTFVIAPVAGSPASDTIAAGHSASFNLAVTPSGSFNGTVDLACGVSPAVTLAPTCVVPASVQLNAGTPAEMTLMVNTTASISAGTVVHGNFPPGVILVALTVLLFTSTLLLVVNGRRWPALAAPILALTLIPISGCGGSSSSSSSGTPANTYKVTVTATSGSLVSKTTLTVIVQ